jgi:hypothetical protein
VSASARPAIARAAVVCALSGATAAAGPLPAPSAERPGQADRIEYRDPAAAPSRGPAHALVTIELFLVPGPNLPTGLLALLQQLQDRHPTRIRLVYRILKSGSAVLVPSAALEAQAEGKFFELMTELTKQRTVLKKEDLSELTRRIGVDPQRATQAYKLERYLDALDANQRRFERLHAGTTPSVLFNAKPASVALSTVSAGDLERDYQAAYDRAIDKVDRGFAADQLGDAFDDEAMLGTQPIVPAAALRDDDTERGPREHPLASPPLRLAGLPSFGQPGVDAAVPIAVLCRPNDASCGNLLRVVEPEMRLYPDDVRIVWAPWFDVGRDDTAELTLLGDAALCAEAIGSNGGELTTSPGWAWVKEMYAQSGRSHGKKLPADKLIDAVALRLELDGRALSACRARIAGATLEWIAAARRAGVSHGSAAVVIGGRIYDGLTDQTLIHELVEAELAPGILGSLPRWQPGK